MDPVGEITKHLDLVNETLKKMELLTSWQATG